MEEKILPSTYLTWVLLWINAIKDSYLWIDSPDCFFMKCDIIQWNHDLNSILRKANWEHKILSTISDVDNIIDNRNSNFVKSLSDMASKDFTNLIFVSSMPMSQLVWVDYDWLIESVNKNYPNKSIFNIPSKSMTDCWLDWYSDLLFSLAKNIDISWANPSSNKVAIVWNMFDRNEWDSKWNIEELKNIFNWLWLEIVSIWLDWSNYEDILKIKEAWTIISLPYWRKAAKKIANRLWINLLELDIPFWINNTINFINKIWNFFNIKEELINNFIEKELTSNDIWIIKNIVRVNFIRKKISYYWDPYLLNWIIDLSEMLWFDIIQIFIHWSEKHILKNTESIFFNIYDSKIDKNIDLFISIRNNWIDINENNLLEFWFPSYFHHVFTNIPYYWIKWTLNFINRIYNKLLLN